MLAVYIVFIRDYILHHLVRWSIPIPPAQDELRILNKHKQKEWDTTGFFDLMEWTYPLIHHRPAVVNKRSLRIGGYLRLSKVAIYQIWVYCSLKGKFLQLIENIQLSHSSQIQQRLLLKHMNFVSGRIVAPWILFQDLL